MVDSNNPTGLHWNFTSKQLVRTEGEALHEFDWDNWPRTPGEWFDETELVPGLEALDSVRYKRDAICSNTVRRVRLNEMLEANEWLAQHLPTFDRIKGLL